MLETAAQGSASGAVPGAAGAKRLALVGVAFRAVIIVGNGSDGAMSAITIHRVEPDEWEQLRDIRLRALANAPAAFGSSLARERGQSERYWRDWASGTTRSGDRIATFIAVAEDRWLALAAGIRPPDDPQTAALVSMWVDPALRRRGAAHALVEAVAEWARDQGARRLELWVTRKNTPARTLYLRSGFTPDGRTQPLPSRPSLIEEAMIRHL